jgi:NifU-like protein
MGVYPENIARRFRAPQYAGTAENESAAGKAASFECGTFVSISMRIDPDTKAIEDVRFRTNGCGVMIAAADAAAEALTGRELVSLHGVGEEFIDGVISRQAFPDQRRHCLETVFEAVRAALTNFRTAVIQEFRGETALICTCFGVSEDTISELIIQCGITEVAAIGEACNAGTGCGSCRMLIQEMVDAREQ